MKDVSSMLLQMLEEEFNFLINKKVLYTFSACIYFLYVINIYIISILNHNLLLQDQMNIETKIRNIRFIGELCKFKIAPAGLVFSCLKVFVE